MAIDVPAPLARKTRARVLWQTGAVALPVRLVLAGIVGISFAVRFAAALRHTIPLYFPDEYIYSSIARSLAETGRPLVRGGPAHFPALLEPLLAAPFWLFHDPVAAYRLTQAEHSLAMSLAAIPAYLLARRIGLGRGFGLACAVLAVACPDLMYVSFILAEPIAYPLALTAIYAGVCALDRPTWRGQLVFLAWAGLATFARVQFVFLPLALVAAALVVERGRVRTALRSVWLTVLLLMLPVLAMAALGPARLLGYYSSVSGLNLGFGLIRWAANDAMLLAYAAGWILVPGALVGLALAIARPASRAEAAFGALVGVSFVALFAEAGLYASNGSDRFQERYLLLLLPLTAPAFGLCMKRARAGRRAVPLLAVGLLVLSARVPLGSYTIAGSKQDSPFLFAVFRLEQLVDLGSGSLLVAILAAGLAAVAAAVAVFPKRRTAAGIALGLSMAVAVTVSVAAVSYDNANTRHIQASFLGPDVRAIDHAGLGPTDVVETAGAPSERTLEQLFWNTSLRRLLLLGQADPVDAFSSPRIAVAADGRLLVAGVADRRPLLVSRFATQTTLIGVTQVWQDDAFTLYRPAGTPRLSILAAGLYTDGWLAGAGTVSVWPEAVGATDGTLSLRLSLPPGPGSMTLSLRAPGVRRSVTLRPGTGALVTLGVHGPAPWVLHFSGARLGHLADGRAVTMMTQPPVFHPTGRIHRVEPYPAAAGQAISATPPLPVLPAKS